MLTIDQISNCRALIEAGYECNFSRQQLVHELMAELKCSGMFAGQALDAIIYKGMKGKSFDPKYFHRYHRDGYEYYDFQMKVPTE